MLLIELLLPLPIGLVLIISAFEFVRFMIFAFSGIWSSLERSKNEL